MLNNIIPDVTKNANAANSHLVLSWQGWHSVLLRQKKFTLKIVKFTKTYKCRLLVRLLCTQTLANVAFNTVLPLYTRNCTAACSCWWCKQKRSNDSTTAKGSTLRPPTTAAAVANEVGNDNNNKNGVVATFKSPPGNSKQKATNKTNLKHGKHTNM